MTLNDIFDYLATGELSQLFMGDDGEPLTDGIAEKDRLRVAKQVMRGLIDLHTRFMLREEVITINVSQSRNVYPLEMRYSMSNPKKAEDAFIVDSPEFPLQNRPLRIERIKDQDGCDVPLNELDVATSIRTPVPHVLALPKEHTFTQLEVVYRAGPAPFPAHLIEAAPQLIEVNLPESHLEPLAYFVGSRIFTPMGVQGEFHDGNNYAAKYEAACQGLKLRGFSTSTYHQDVHEDRVAADGWV